jgi:hypothetical protein
LLLGLLVGCLLRFGLWCGGGIRLLLFLLLGGCFCLVSGGLGCFLLLRFLCTLGFLLGGGLCWFGCCPCVGRCSGGLSGVGLLLLLIFGCLGGGRLPCGICLFFRRLSIILCLVGWWGFTCGLGALRLP